MCAPEDHLNSSDHDVTGLLRAWGGGDLAARDELMAVVHQELRRRAAARLRREQAGHVLQPTALVHEAYLRLVDQRRTDWQSRAHFFAMASEMMRRILVDHARRRKMGKRSGGWARVALDEAVAKREPRDVDLLDLDAALSELALFDPRKSRLVELRFFGGLSLDGQCGSAGRLVRDRRPGLAVRSPWLFRRITRRPDSVMTPDRLQEVERLYHAAQARPNDLTRPVPRRGMRVDSPCKWRSNRCSLPSAAAAGFMSTPAGRPAGCSARTASFVGRQLGPYAIQSPLGAGGMGEVYRARDTKLGRDVAIKILPRIFTSDPDRLARFEREARLLASLNHPNIGAIYGLEDVDGIPALVLELVEGDTLAERLRAKSGRPRFAETT